MTSWLEELERDFRYRCAHDHVSLYQMPSSTPEEEVRADAECLECGESAKYEGFEPLKMNLLGKVLYDQNGRLAYRITDGKGKVTHISKTKYDYLESAGTIKPAYTKEYREQLLKEGRTDLLEERKVTKRVRKPEAGSIKPVVTRGV